MIPHELLLVLFGVAIGSIWAVGERSLRRTLEESRARLIQDVEYWRSYALGLLNQDRKVKKTAANVRQKQRAKK